MVKADSTTRSSAACCSALRTMLPAPAGASRCSANRPPAGEWISTVADPRRCRSCTLGIGEAGRDRVAVPSERDGRVRRDHPSDLDRRRERGSGQSEERLGVAQRADGRADTGGGAALAGVARSGQEAVQRQLRLLRCGRGHGPPPPSTREPHRGFDRALAVPAPWRARLHDRAVVLRHRRERWLHVDGSRARSPSPAGRCATRGRCRPGGASPRPSPRSGAPGRATRPARHASATSAAACPTARRRSRPTVLDAARTSPTGSPRPAGGRSRSCRGPSPRGTPRNAAAARAGGPDARTSGSCARSRARRPRRTTTSPTDAGHRRTGPGCRPRSRPAGRAPQ